MACVHLFHFYAELGKLAIPTIHYRHSGLRLRGLSGFCMLPDDNAIVAPQPYTERNESGRRSASCDALQYGRFAGDDGSENRRGYEDCSPELEHRSSESVSSKYCRERERCEYSVTELTDRSCSLSKVSC